MKFIAHLQRWRGRKRSPLGTLAAKRVEITATDLAAALATVPHEYPGWDISMFWPEWPQPQPSTLCR